MNYPAFWFLVALLAAALHIWLPFMVLAVIGALVLGGLDVWKERQHDRNALGR